MPDATFIDYTYAHNGQRVQQTVGADTTHYLWDEYSTYGDVVLETDGVLAPQIAYVNSDCGCPSAEKRLISQTQSGDTHFYLHDALGSTRALTDNSGTVSDTYRYAAFGELIDSTGITPNKYLFTGQQFDVLTGQYSLRARYYAPTSGRFLSYDTWDVQRENPLELNRYLYVANNSINYIDPLGLYIASSYGVSVSEISLVATSSLFFISASIYYLPDLINALDIAIDILDTITFLDEDNSSDSTTNADDSKLTREEKRTVRSLERQIEEHTRKLREYIHDPDAFDNKGFLQNAPDEKTRRRIIDGRVRHLEHEIENWQQQIDNIRRRADDR